MIKAMLESNVFDRLLDDIDTQNSLCSLVEQEKIELLSTSIQRHELEAILHIERRKRLVSIFDDLNVKIVLAEGGFWDTFMWDEAKWGGDDVNADLQAFVGESSQHRADATIAVTATRLADWLVTENQRDFRHVKNMRSQVEVLNFDDFKQRLRSIGHSGFADYVS